MLGFTLPHYSLLVPSSLTLVLRLSLEPCNCLLGVLNIHLNQYTDKDRTVWLGFFVFSYMKFTSHPQENWVRAVTCHSSLCLQNHSWFKTSKQPANILTAEREMFGINTFSYPLWVCKRLSQKALQPQKRMKDYTEYRSWANVGEECNRKMNQSKPECHLSSLWQLCHQEPF